MKCLKKLIPFVFVVIFSVVVILVSENTDSRNVSAPVCDKTIIIDAGHGGPDGGAVAADGTQEQYLNLDIALKMNEYLTSRGYKTVLTRSDDNSIHDADADTVRKKKVTDLHNRLEIINSTPNPVFVSVHQNYYTESKYSGTQVFYSANNNESSLLAECIQRCVVDSLQPDNTRQIKESGKSIFLLYNSTVPSVLVECGFLSNVQETEKLKDENYRTQMAEAICEGIINYISVSSEAESETA